MRGEKKAIAENEEREQKQERERDLKELEQLAHKHNKQIVDAE